MTTLDIKAQLLLLEHLRELSSHLQITGHSLSRLVFGLSPHLNCKGHIEFESYSAVELSILRKQIEAGDIGDGNFEILHSEVDTGAVGKMVSSGTKVEESTYLWVPPPNLRPGFRVVLKVRSLNYLNAIRRKTNSNPYLCLNSSIFMFNSEIESYLDISSLVGGDCLTLLQLEPKLIFEFESQAKMAWLGSIPTSKNGEIGSGTLCPSRSGYASTCYNLESLKSLLATRKDQEIRRMLVSFLEGFGLKVRMDEQAILQLSADPMVRNLQVISTLPNLYTCNSRPRSLISTLKERCRNSGFKLKEYRVEYPSGSSKNWCLKFNISVASGHWCWTLKQEPQFKASIPGNKRVMSFSNIDPNFELIFQGKIVQVC